MERIKKEDKVILAPSVVSSLPPVVDGYKPSEAEVRILRVILDADFMRSNPDTRKICDAAEVNSVQTYYNALRKKGFVDTIKMYAVDPCKGKVGKYVGYLEEYASKGSWPHLKALLAMTDTYVEKKEDTVATVRAIIMPGRFVEEKEEQG